MERYPPCDVRELPPRRLASELEENHEHKKTNLVKTAGGHG